MLSVDQTRIVQWERDVAELDDASMVTLANSLFTIPSFWADLETDLIYSNSVSHEGETLLIIYRCLSAEDILQLLILAVQ